jgi:anthranilate synthase component 2
LKVCIVDYYDSFTFNLAHYIEGLGHEVVVISDANLDIAFLNAFDKILLSPGPGLPADTKTMFPILETYGKIKPILGICLGMQGIAAYYGQKLYNLNVVKHGVPAQVQLDNKASIFKNIPENIAVGLYHSWAIALVDDQFKPIAWSEDQVLMAIEHEKFPLYGVQFHPESILTPEGKKILANFLSLH